MLADRRYCYPLTITDAASRYLLSCEALSSTKAKYCHPQKLSERRLASRNTRIATADRVRHPESFSCAPLGFLDLAQSRRDGQN
jgi:hypothetical protein